MKSGNDAAGQRRRHDSGDSSLDRAAFAARMDSEGRLGRTTKFRSNELREFKKSSKIECSHDSRMI